MSTIEGSIRLDMDRVMPHVRAYVALCTANNTDMVRNEKYMKALSFKQSHDKGVRKFFTDVEGLVTLVKMELYV